MVWQWSPFMVWPWTSPSFPRGLSTDLGALDNQIRVLDIVASNVASCLEVLGTHVLQKRAQEAEAAVGRLQVPPAPAPAAAADNSERRKAGRASPGAAMEGNVQG